MASKWLKKFAAAAAVYLLAVTLFATSSAAVFHFVIADAGSVKEILKDSGAYRNITGAFLDEIAKNSDNKESTVPIDDPKIQKIAKKAFSPDVIQANTEEFIDGTYAWLNGETEQAEFTLDFTKSKNRLAKGVGEYAQKRAAKLPPCGFYDIPKEVQALELDCLPPGITAKQIGAKTVKDLKKDEGFLPETKITPETLFEKDRDNPFKQQQAPSNFRVLKNIIWVLLILAAIFTSGSILLGEDRAKGIKKAARSFLVIGILVVLTPFSLNFFSDRLSEGSLFSDKLSKQVALPVIEEFIGAVSTVYYVFGGVCILLGIAGLVAAQKLKDKESTPGRDKVNK